MKKVLLALSAVFLINTYAASSFAGNPGAVSCLRDMAYQRFSDRKEIKLVMGCNKKRPNYRIISWVSSKGFKIKGKSTIAFNVNEIKMCGNPCK